MERNAVRTFSHLPAHRRRVEQQQCESILQCVAGGSILFVFMTGFGHAMYFYTRNNFRLGRVLRVLFRLNLTAFLLSATMNRPYILYYVCPLHSLAFLLTYGIMKAQQSSNYSKYGLRMKLLVLVAAIFLCGILIWDSSTCFLAPSSQRAPYRRPP
jgi:hypothetical protein